MDARQFIRGCMNGGAPFDLPEDFDQSEGAEIQRRFWSLGDQLDQGRSVTPLARSRFYVDRERAEAVLPPIQWRMLAGFVSAIAQLLEAVQPRE